MKVYLVLGHDAHDTVILEVYGNREDARKASEEYFDDDFAFVSVCEKEVKGEIK